MYFYIPISMPSFPRDNHCPKVRDLYSNSGLPQRLRGKKSSCSAGDTGYTDLITRWGRSPGGKNGNRSPVFLLGKSQGQRSLVDYSPWGHNELDTTEATEHTQVGFYTPYM